MNDFELTVSDLYIKYLTSSSNSIKLYISYISFFSKIHGFINVKVFNFRRNVTWFVTFSKFTLLSELSIADAMATCTFLFWTIAFPDAVCETWSTSWMT